MKDLLGKVSDLTRTSLQDLKKIYTVSRLVSLVDAIDTENPEEDTVVTIPLYGKIIITKDLDFSFIPDSELRRDTFNLKQNPENYLKKELKKLLKIEDTAKSYE